MMHQTIEPTADADGKESIFLIHIAAFLDFDLEKYLQELKKDYAVCVIKGAGTNIQSFTLKIDSLQLRALQKALPLSVAVSYETLERPEHC